MRADKVCPRCPTLALWGRGNAMATKDVSHRLVRQGMQYDLCPRHCHLKEDQRGLCYVRQRLDDEIKLVSYGRSSGFCVDPIEKKPLNHYYPGSAVLSFGTAGCNLACKFCQNWDMSKSREMDTLADAASPQKLAKVAQELACLSVAFTYNDPVIFHEYAIDVAAACCEQDVNTVAVTAGYIDPEPRVEFFDAMDAANVDLKAFTERFTTRSAADIWRRCSRPSSTSIMKPMYGLKSQTC